MMLPMGMDGVRTLMDGRCIGGKPIAAITEFHNDLVGLR